MATQYGGPCDTCGEEPAEFVGLLDTADNKARDKSLGRKCYLAEWKQFYGKDVAPPDLSHVPPPPPLESGSDG